MSISNAVARWACWRSPHRETAGRCSYLAGAVRSGLLRVTPGAIALTADAFASVVHALGAVLCPGGPTLLREIYDMTDNERACLDTFPEWLRSLATDAKDLGETVGDESLAEDVRRLAAGGLNYLFKSLDLIPDGIEDLGYLDDAFVLRVAAKLAVASGSDIEEKAPRLARLAGDAALIEGLLGDDFARLSSYVSSLRTGAARGRSVDDILGEPDVRRDFLNEVAGWATSYEPPSFGKDEKNLVKLKAFMAAKLP